jgi:hypothetical protein
MPPADQNRLLLFLQGRAAFLRRELADLVEREALLRKAKMFASADAMKERVAKTSRELKTAEKKLSAHERSHKKGEL